jgi:hypothetical protein
LPAQAKKEEAEREQMLTSLIDNRVVRMMYKVMDVATMAIKTWSAEAMKTMIGE